jgi:protein SEY1
VLTNKDLDLPTQQELLAQFRCNEISAEALAEFNNQAERQKQPIEEGKVINGLGEMMRSCRSGALGEEMNNRLMCVPELIKLYSAVRS